MWARMSASRRRTRPRSCRPSRAGASRLRGWRCLRRLARPRRGVERGAAPGWRWSCWRAGARPGWPLWPRPRAGAAGHRASRERWPVHPTAPPCAGPSSARPRSPGRIRPGKPPRFLRRLFSLKGVSHDEGKRVFTRGSRACRSHGAVAPRRVPAVVGQPAPRRNYAGQVSPAAGRRRRCRRRMNPPPTGSVCVRNPQKSLRMHSQSSLGLQLQT